MNRFHIHVNVDDIPQSIQFYNTLFRRIMHSLKMVQMNKNYYNPRAGNMVPQHKLEIWPG